MVLTTLGCVGELSAVAGVALPFWAKLRELARD